MTAVISVETRLVALRSTNRYCMRLGMSKDCCHSVQYW